MAKNRLLLMIGIVLVAIGVVGLSACASVGTHTTATIPQQHTSEAQVYVSRCSVCHATPHPRRLSYEAWKNVVPVMERRMAERGMTALSEQDRQSILAYLQGNAR